MHRNVFSFLLLVLISLSASAATFNVTRNDDRNTTCVAGDCSLREAVAAANAAAGDDTITFNLTIPATISLTNGSIAISSNISIAGPGQTQLTVTGNNASRIFTISGATNVTISDVTLTAGNGGAGPAGGAILGGAGGSLLTLDTVRITNSTGGGNAGGAIATLYGSLTVLNSTFSNNTATSGGAIYHDGATLKVQGSTFNGNSATRNTDPDGGGAIYTDDPTVISNSTFTGNSSAYAGGAVFFIGTGIETLVVRNSTVTGNSGGVYVGGIANFGDGGGTVANNIIANNTAPSLPDYYDGGSISFSNNYTGATPNLGPLASNGGPTQTMALLPGSPAINAGSNAAALDVNGNPLTTDQRGGGFPRMVGNVDLGAYESGTNLLTVTKAADTADGTCDADCSLREAVTAANALAGADVVDFVPALAGQTISLSLGDIPITGSMTILGLGASQLTVSGNNASRIFTISGAISVTISDMTLTAGNGGAGPAGGAILGGAAGSLLTLDTVRITNSTGGGNVGGAVATLYGSLTVLNSTFSNNTATAGGAIYHDGGTLKVQGSTFNGNSATRNTDPDGGGAIYTDDPTVISNSTFSGNSSGYAGGAVFFIGTGIETLVVRNSTITGNSAGVYVGGIANLGDGGGTVANNILALNTAPSLPDYYDGGSITFANNYTGAAPLIGPLADNGGPTQTHALLCGSPAYNTGSNAQALDINGAALTTDQRGLSRFVGTVDMGAYEAQVPPPCPPSISIGDVTLAEGNSGTTNFVFTVTLSATSASTVTVNFATADGTAAAGSDYTTVSGTVTFPPSTTSQTITVPVAGETLYEADETFFVDLTAPSNATITDAQALGTITNDDSVPAIGIAGVSLPEGNSGTTNFDFVVSLTNPSSSTITVDYASADGTATSADYTAASGTLTFDPGVVSQSVTIGVTGDLLNEPDETFTVSLTSPANASIATDVATGTIQNDDAVPTLSIGNVSQLEGDAGTSLFTFTVTLSASSGQTVTVDFATADFTASAGSDYTTASGTLTFAPGITSQQFTVTVNGDTLSEPDETFNVILSSPSNATIATGTATGTIQSDDAPPVLDIASVTSPEGTGGTVDFVFTVTLSRVSAQTVTVNYASSNGTASAGSDYTPVSGTLTFNPGVTSQSLPVTVIGDSTNELDELFHLTLSSPLNATLGQATATGAILNDDAPPVTVTDAIVVEGTGADVQMIFKISLDQASALPVTVAWSTADGSAIGGSDYVPASGEAFFRPGLYTRTVSVAIKGDSLVESAENLFLHLTGASNAIITDDTGTGTIIDDDSMPVLTITDASVFEGDSGMTAVAIVVNLSRAATDSVTATFHTSAGTASAGSDFVTTGGSISFAPGETQKTIVVQVVGDTVRESDETFSLILDNITAAAVASSTATVTIVDDDGLLIIPVVGSTAGSFGSDYRTSAQIHNASGSVMSGKFVFHPQGVEGSDSDPFFEWTLAPGETRSLADVLTELHVTGVGSLDISSLQRSALRGAFRIFNDAGEAGTTGAMLQPLSERSALHASERGILLAPADAAHYRFNVGVRTLSSGATLNFTLRRADGTVVTSTTRTYPPTYFTQTPAQEVLGASPDANAAIDVEVIAGDAIVYGSAADNRTQDASTLVPRSVAGETSGARRLLPVTGSLAGDHGSFFRTQLQLHDPRFPAAGAEAISGAIVFHAEGVEAKDTDPSVPYSILPGETISFADVVQSIGASGLGSIEIIPQTGDAPVAAARVFNDRGEDGTAGLAYASFDPDDVLTAGKTGVLLVPEDLTHFRLNVGYRTLEDGATVRITVRSASGDVTATREMTIGAGTMRQVTANDFTGTLLTGGESISISVEEGSGLFYGSSADNRTNDPSLQFAESGEYR